MVNGMLWVAHQGYHVVSIGARISVYEAVLWNELKKNGLWCMLHHEQNSVALMKELAWKLSEPSDFVLDDFATTPSTGN